ncbi:MAG: hypothetical protein QGG40_13485, partial [Myxococcota bacterium]|nr:hypothetical protein [Myxococcota bacterium]
SAFYPGVQVIGASDFEFDRQFQAWLLTEPATEFEGVTLEDYSTLSARVPSGLEKGSYGVRLISPSGQTVTLEDAFLVTDTRADHMAIEVERVTFEVNELALVRFQLEDPVDDPVSQALDIQVTTSSDLVVFEEDTLVGQVVIEGGIEGSLDQTGHGYVALTSPEPAEIWVSVDASDADSVVAGDTQFLAFTAGSVTGVDIALPKADFSTEAGMPFEVDLALVDEDGNEVSGVTASVLLYEECSQGTYQGTVQLVDQTSEEIAVTGATGFECDSNRIVAIGSADGVAISGVSDEFEVLAGEAVQYQALATPDEVEAGVDSIHLWVWAEDEWGNLVEDYNAALVLSDSEGGLDSEAGIGQQSCDEFTVGLAFCEAVLWKAGSAVRIFVEGDDDLSAISNEISVLPGVASSLVVSLEDSHSIAGEPLVVSVRALDAFGNPLVLDPEGTDVPTIEDGSGELTCPWSGSIAPEGTESFTCTPTLADESAVFFVEIPSRAVSTSSDPVTIVNGELAEVSLDVGGVGTVGAGEELSVVLAGYDAYGNPYLEQSDPGLDLVDASGSVSPANATLDSSGQVSVDAVFTVAVQDNRVTAKQSGVELGESPEFDVVAAEIDHLQVDVSSTWAWAEEGIQAQVSAVDIYGNPVTSYSVDVTVESVLLLGDSVLVNDFEDGVAVFNFSFEQARLQDHLYVTDEVEGVDGASTFFDVLDAECTAGPTADLEVTGGEPVVLCRTSGSTATVTLSTTGSVVGESALAAFHYDLGEGDWSRTTDLSIDTSWTEEGAWIISGVIADESACG